jgi:IS605 OrfB family transposase
VYLHIAFEREVPKAVPTGRVIGIDRGINNLAVSSDGRFFGGQKVKSVVRKRQFLRTVLQKANSKSAKRQLRKESRREKQFRADINHQISKEIVSSLQPGDIIVLENLKGIRNGAKKFRKKTKTAMNSWSFYQLEQFIIYKAEAKCVSVFKIPAHYTSQTCSKCGHCDKNNRHGSQFKCKQCGFQLDADLNGSRNIRDKYLASPTTAKPAGQTQKVFPTAKHPTSKRKAVASFPPLPSDQADINQPIVSPLVVL